MKKSYVKPKVYFENFQLSANIARTCSEPLNHTKDDCVKSGLPLFTQDLACSILPDNNGLCYQTVVEVGVVFDS